MQSGENSQSGGLNRRKIAGWGFITADAALFIHGLLDYLAGYDKKGAKSRMMTGLGWGIGGIALAKYGAQPVAKQQERIENKLAHFMEGAGVALNHEQKQQAESYQNRSVWQKFENFIYDRPTEVLNSYYAAAATGLVSSGFSKYNTHMQGNVKPGKLAGDLGRSLIAPHKSVPGTGDLTSGLLVILGGLYGIFVKEKAPRTLKEGGFLNKLIHTKPLALSSALFMANNYGGFLAGMEERREALANDGRPGNGKHHRYLLRFLMVGLYVISNLMVGSGSKKASGKPEEHEAALEKILQQAGEMIATLPASQQQEQARLTAEYLVKQKELRLIDRDPQELAAIIMNAIPSRPVAATTEPAAIVPSQQQELSAQTRQEKTSQQNYRQRIRKEEEANALAGAVAIGA